MADQPISGLPITTSAVGSDLLAIVHTPTSSVPTTMQITLSNLAVDLVSNQTVAGNKTFSGATVFSGPTIALSNTGTTTISAGAAGANDALVINATGGTSGNLLDLQLGGVNKTYFNNAGSLFFTGLSGTTFPGGSIYSPLNDYVRLTATDANGGGFLLNNTRASTTIAFFQSASSTKSYVDFTGSYIAGSSIYGPTSATVNGNITLLAQGAVSAALYLQNGAGSSIMKVDASNNLNIGWNGTTNTTLDTAGNLTIPATFKAGGGVFPAGQGTAGPGTFAGTGVPTFSAPSGSLYMRYDGAANARLYVNTSTASTSGTTWSAMTTP